MKRMSKVQRYGRGMRQNTSDRWGPLRALRLGGLGGVMCVALACSGATKTGGDDPDQTGPAAATPDEPGASEEAEAPIELGPITKGSFREHPAGVAWAFDPGADGPRKIDIGQAEALGYQIIDLSDDWVPYIFSKKTAGLEDETDNVYRQTYVDLANDRVDHWGDERDPGEHNYLELYGIPPALSIVHAEWDKLDTEVKPCLEAAGFDRGVFEGFTGTIAFRKAGRTKRNKAARWAFANLKKKMRKAKLDSSSAADLEAAATNPATKKAHARWRESQDEIDIIDHAQRRFRCEKLFNGGDHTGKFDQGVYDSATTHALANFERKHDVMGWGHFKQDNTAVLALTPDEAVHARFLRVLTERIVSGAGIIEDGSAKAWKERGSKSFTYKDAEGSEHELRDLVSEYREAAIEAMGLQTPESAKAQLAALSDLGEGDFENLLVAVKMPPKPAYYSSNMQFSTHIDRGDVWYDFPYDEEGNKKGQPRRRFPHLTLYVEYEGQKIPIVHWRTTIGSWRNEIKDGEVMLKYKNSDVGDRVWKNIMAAPVWIPPPATPHSELIKGEYRKGKFRRGVNYPNIGPGYKSAYGLVAAYHIKQVENSKGEVLDFDNGIRTHGSVDYMSILRRFSHGCHRLYNMDAVRLFSMVLRHREYSREGQQTVGVGRWLEVEERRYHMKIETRGYKYTLVEPIPVTVTSGRIKGRRHSPIAEYVPKPIKEEELEEEAEAADSDSDSSLLGPLFTP